MKTLITALALAALIAVPAFAQSAAAAPKARRDSDQSRARRDSRDSDQSRARRDSNGSWQCYPYCDGGTYEGRPVREWMKPDRW
jgi:hypothetical protein